MLNFLLPDSFSSGRENTSSRGGESQTMTTDVDQEHNIEDNKVQLFEVSAKIVGKRYYKGRMNDGEAVYLIREPKNPYDCNAIRVDNLNHVQVGHISAKCGTASTLSPIQDYRLTGKAGGELEAVIVSGSDAVYSANVMITVIGLPEHEQVIQSQLTKGRIPFKNLMSGQKYFGFEDVKIKSSKTPPNYQRLSEDQVLQQLDNIWESGENLAKQDILPHHLSNIKNIFISDLYPHQIYGISWMLQRESGVDTLPPFYSEVTEGRKKSYFNSLVCHNFENKPANILGGMLCDDMGLGKSLMTLAVIAANKVSVNTSLSASVVDDVDSGKKKRKTTSKSSKASTKASAETAAITEPSLNTPTLIVCPLSVISSWQDQIATHIKPDGLTYFVYHGSHRDISDEELSKFDIVITTYDVLAFEVSIPADASNKRKHESILQTIQWSRIVLDEGHIVRNMKTKRFQAIHQLTSRFKWFLSGTPIMNSVADLHSAMQFLRLEPFTMDQKLFDRYFTRLVKVGNTDAMLKLRGLVKIVALRRLKANVIADHMPPKSEFIVNVELGHEEREAYDAITNAISEYMAFLSTLDGGTNNQVMRNSQSILGFITRLRQTCNDCSMVPADALVRLLSFYKSTTKGSAESMVARLSDETKQQLLDKFKSLFVNASGNSSTVVVSEDESVECSVCFDPLNENSASIFQVCKHTFCDACIERLFANSIQQIHCPMCRCSVSKNEVIPFKMLEQTTHSEESASVEPKVSSSKCSSKTKEILNAAERIRSTSPDEKIVIFSSFVTYLEILQSEFESRGFKICRITGDLSQSNRAKQIQLFNKDDSYTVMLCSLKAAGVGITLTRANHVFLTDLWWSPAADIQAIDRVYRLGQNRPVSVMRFLVKNSIDEKIFEIQQEKSELSKLTLEANAAQIREDRLKKFTRLLM